MKYVYLAILLLVFAIPVSGQIVITNLDKTSEAATLLSEAYRTNATAAASMVSSDFSASQHRGWRFNVAIIDTVDSAATKTPGLIITIQGKSQKTGKYFTLLVSDTLYAEGITTSLLVHPDITAVTNLMVKDVAPYYLRVSAAIVDTGAISFSIDGEPVR